MQKAAAIKRQEHRSPPFLFEFVSS